MAALVKQTSFLEALQGRYGAVDTTTYSDDAFCVSDPSATPNARGRLRNAKKWEMVGMEQTRQKQAQHSKLTAVTLKNEGINVAQKECGEIAGAQLSRLKEMDVSENTEITWGLLCELVRELPALTSLQASDIPALFAPSGPSQVMSSAILTKLILNNVGFTNLRQIRALTHLPALGELHLDCNGIRVFSLSPSAADHGDGGASAEPPKVAECDRAEQWFSTVHTLSLSHNQLASWEESGLHVSLPVAFPQLRRLFLADNLLPSIPFPAAAFYSSGKLARADVEASAEDAADAENTIAEWRERYRCLSALELLCVQENRGIVDRGMLDSIRELCPALTTLRITYGYLYTSGVGNGAGEGPLNETLARMLAVASLPTVTTLNRAQVRQKERFDSELFYVQRGLTALTDAQRRAAHGEADLAALKAAVFQQFPLFDTLREKHKDVVEAIYENAAIQASAPTDGAAALATDGASCLILNIRLHCDGYDEHRRRIPSSVTVGALKALLRAVFAIDPAHQQLSFRPGDDAVIMRAVPMMDEQASLGSFGVMDGAIITVKNTSLR